ncbi:MAG TPA: ATP-binding protein [Burkholderiales bacterium]|nr:ATP-binding protein [Burkholderiales bacterium]
MRKAFRRKVWKLSVGFGLAICIVVLFVGLAQRLIPAYQQLGERNQLTLSRISCVELGDKVAKPTGGRTCDLSAVEDDPNFDSADYLLDRRTHFFIYNRGKWPAFRLNFSDLTFIRGFRDPKSASFETGDRWRLYSESADSDGKKVEVLVGVLEHSPRMLGQVSVGPDIDEQLKNEAQKIIRQLRKERISSRADGWQVVDEASGRVIQWSGDVPAYYPKELYETPVAFHLEEGQMWLVRGATSENLHAVSLESVGALFTYGLFGIGAFLFGSLATYPIARKFGRTGITHPVSLDEALRTGESGFVEFKQEIKERQQMLVAVTAFANSNGGTLFIGIVDGTLEIIGIDAATPDKKDAFATGLRNSIRQNIQPSPDVDIDFPSEGGHVIGRIFVRASPQRHSFEGRYYVREGSQCRYLVNGEIGNL